jgi:hypothetical protein
MKTWNEFDYTTQTEVMDFIDNLRKKAPPYLKEAVVAAVYELEMWANSPCQEIDVDEEGRVIAHARTPYGES